MEDKSMKLKVIAFGILSTAVLFANTPSFDCSKVKKDSSESIICASDKLMTLDRELAKVYKKALHKSSKGDELKAMQRGWIKRRNDCWKNADEAQCMKKQYKMRIRGLKEQYSLDTPASYSFDKALSLQGIRFHMMTTGEGSVRQLSIVTTGFSRVNDAVHQEIEGQVVGAQVADLNRDGSPEIYIYVSSAGSGSYGSLVAYSSNNNKSMSAIYLPELSDDKNNSIGYMGHDEFSVTKSSLDRRFPVYKKGDSNANPTGGMRQLTYTLHSGEAGWVLKLVHSTELKQ